LALLDGRTGLADEEGAAAVAAELNYLPLALAQAAAVIAGQRLGYRSYLDRLWALPTEEYLTGEDRQLYPRGVAEALLLVSLEAVQTADQSGVCTPHVMEKLVVACRCKSGPGSHQEPGSRLAVWSDVEEGA
jgi:hypothetical protein